MVLTRPPCRDRGLAPSAAASSSAPSRSTSARGAGGNGGARPSAGPCGSGRPSGRTDRRPAGPAPRARSAFFGPRPASSSSSSKARYWRHVPGSPWRPQRPANWRSMRAASCISVQITCRPPNSAMPSPSLMSVPRPAMLVETVTRPRWPARATMSASAAILMGVEHLVLDPLGGEQLGEVLRLVDRAGADQHRPALGVKLADFLDHGRPFRLRRAEDLRPQPLADGRPVGGDGQHVAAIDFAAVRRPNPWPCPSCRPDSRNAGRSPGW